MVTRKRDFVSIMAVGASPHPTARMVEVGEAGRRGRRPLRRWEQSKSLPLEGKVSAKLTDEVENETVWLTFSLASLVRGAGFLRSKKTEG